MSSFYVVATPIGNLGDITLRALEVLRSVDVVLCEDTRVTKKLFDKYEIRAQAVSYHSQSKISKTEKIFELLEAGKNLALVSDAGTPAVSDPGSMLVAGIRERFGEDVTIIPIPGASALTAAISAAGLHTHEFTFLGFLPHKKGRETLFKEIAVASRAYVFYESTHRILKTLESLKEFCPEKKVCVAREITKMFEEFKIGQPAEILEYYQSNPEKQKGEFTVIVS